MAAVFALDHEHFTALRQLLAHVIRSDDGSECLWVEAKLDETDDAAAVLRFLSFEV